MTASSRDSPAGSPQQVWAWLAWALRVGGRLAGMRRRRVRAGLGGRLAGMWHTGAEGLRLINTASGLDQIAEGNRLLHGGAVLERVLEGSAQPECGSAGGIGPNRGRLPARRCGGGADDVVGELLNGCRERACVGGSGRATETGDGKGGYYGSFGTYRGEQVWPPMAWFT